jgi:hypothetical protein
MRKDPRFFRRLRVIRVKTFVSVAGPAGPCPRIVEIIADNG